MKRVKLRSGREFSQIAWGLGSPPSSFSVDQAEQMLRTCLELGVTTIDNAENYGGYTREKLLGDAMARIPGIRPKMELVTKCGCVGSTDRYPSYYMYHYDTRKEHIIEAAENSLLQMRTDYLDMLLLHRFDPLMRPEEVTEAFMHLKRNGKVLGFGVSNFNPWEMEMLSASLDIELEVNEIQFSAIHQQAMWDGSLPYCQRNRVIPLVWGPLGRGALFTATEGIAFDTRKEMERVAQELGGESIDQVALQWVIQHPSQAIPILGTALPSELRSNVKAIEKKLDRQQWFRITNAGLGCSVP